MFMALDQQWLRPSQIDCKWPTTQQTWIPTFDKQQTMKSPEYGATSNNIYRISFMFCEALGCEKQASSANKLIPWPKGRWTSNYLWRLGEEGISGEDSAESILKFCCTLILFDEPSPSCTSFTPRKCIVPRDPNSRCSAEEPEAMFWAHWYSIKTGGPVVPGETPLGFMTGSGYMPYAPFEDPLCTESTEWIGLLWDWFEGTESGLSDRLLLDIVLSTLTFCFSNWLRPRPRPPNLCFEWAFQLPSLSPDWS